MRRGTFGAGLLAAIISMTALSACATASHPAPSPTAVAETTSPSPTGDPTHTTSPSPTSDSEVAEAGAESAVRHYYAAVDKLRSDPQADLAGLDATSVSVALESSKHLLQTERSKGQHQTGTTGVVELDVKGVNLANTDAEGHLAPLVQVDVCIDVSKVDLLDSSGKSVVAAGRPTRGWERHTVINRKWATDPSGGWRVSTIETLEQKPCDAAG